MIGDRLGDRACRTRWRPRQKLPSRLQQGRPQTACGLALSHRRSLACKNFPSCRFSCRCFVLDRVLSNSVSCGPGGSQAQGGKFVTMLLQLRHMKPVGPQRKNSRQSRMGQRQGKTVALAGNRPGCGPTVTGAARLARAIAFEPRRLRRAPCRRLGGRAKSTAKSTGRRARCRARLGAGRGRP